MHFQDEESQYLAAQVKKTLKINVSHMANWGRFAFLLLVGIILIALSIPFSSIMIVNPKPFTLLFSLGSIVILFALLQITTLTQIIQRSGSLFVFIIYSVSLMLGLYAGLFQVGYSKTITVMIIQFVSLVYLLISQFPGGKEGFENCIFNMWSRFKGQFKK